MRLLEVPEHVAEQIASVGCSAVHPRQQPLFEPFDQRQSVVVEAIAVLFAPVVAIPADPQRLGNARHAAPLGELAEILGEQLGRIVLAVRPRHPTVQILVQRLELVAAAQEHERVEHVEVGRRPLRRDQRSRIAVEGAQEHRRVSVVEGLLASGPEQLERAAARVPVHAAGC